MNFRTTFLAFSLVLSGCAGMVSTYVIIWRGQDWNDYAYYSVHPSARLPATLGQDL